MSTTTPASSTNTVDVVAALRFLAAILGQPRADSFSNEESYGMEVLLKMIADKVEGGAA